MNELIGFELVFPCFPAYSPLFRPFPLVLVNSLSPAQNTQFIPEFDTGSSILRKKLPCSPFFPQIYSKSVYQDSLYTQYKQATMKIIGKTKAPAEIKNG